MANDLPAGDVAIEAGRLQRDQDVLKIVIAGHVDHGKSTLIGRLLHDTGSLPEGKREAVAAMCARRGMPFEWAFVTDALQAERDQGVTIDISQVQFGFGRRRYVIVDAPGHKEFLRNMITGAATCDAALLLIDAAEGVKEQSRRHGYLLHLLGIRQVAVLVNKMDLAGWDAERFESIKRDYTAYLSGIGVTAACFVPLSAREGENIVHASPRMPWHRGPSVIEALERFLPPRPFADLPLRLPVQDVYKLDDRRIIAGRIESGRLRVGDSLVFSPANKTARVRSIESWSAPPIEEATAGQSVGITLDEPIFVERGDVASHAANPPIETDVFRARIFWLDAEPLLPHQTCRVRIGPAESAAWVQSIERVINADDLSPRPADRIERNDVAEVTFRTRRILALDDAEASPRTGRIVIYRDLGISGGGIVSMEGYADQRRVTTRRATNLFRVEHRIGRAERARANGHTGAVLWLTGLSGAGKTTLAIEAEARLFAKGYNVYVLDGDNIRSGLNADLGFSPEDRAENIRRVGEAAALFADAGLIVITAFISPYRSDRERARTAAPDFFHEIFVKADLAECERRDPKGLYKRARAGALPQFTGVSAPYEPPEAADLVIDTVAEDVDACVERILDYVNARIVLTARSR